MKPKEGVSTTEFWVTIVTMVAIVVLVITKHPEAVPWIMGAGAAYCGSRGLAKFKPNGGN